MDDTFIDVPCGAQMIMDILEGNGYEAYVVGGCVRDFLIGRKASDWDICTDASPEEMKACFAGKPDISFAENGIKHGTLTVIIHDAEGKHQVYEVTTYRVDGRYTDNRRPETVSFTKDITKDLSRRDFTVNAMAWNAKEGLTDIFGGRKDLEDKIIRCVGKPERRFSEDALRIMRASRFSSQLGFGIEDETFAAMNEKKKLLHNISAERVRIEFIKMLCGEGIIEAADRSREILAEVMPEIRPMFGLDQETRYHIYDVWMHTLHGVKITSIMTTWALENAIDTADSMRSRGYGLSGRTTYSNFRFEARDVVMAIMITAFFTAVIAGVATGAVVFECYPVMRMTSGGVMTYMVFICYFVICIGPAALNLMEEIRWKHLISKI